MSAPDSKIAPWEDFVLRLIAIYKFIKAALALAVGVTLLHLVHHDVRQFLIDYILNPLHFDPDFDPEDESANQFVNYLLQQAAALTPHTIRSTAYISFFYASVFALEGTGLYLKKHWAEYMVLIVTGSFLPFEVYLLCHHPVWWKFALIIGNLLIMGYLFHRIRLDFHTKAVQMRRGKSIFPPTTPQKPERVVSEVP